MQHYLQEMYEGPSLTGRTLGIKKLSRLFIFTQQNRTDNYTGNIVIGTEQTAVKTAESMTYSNRTLHAIKWCHTETLYTSSGAHHAPLLSKLSLTCMNFLKPGLDPVPCLVSPAKHTSLTGRSKRIQRDF